MKIGLTSGCFDLFHHSHLLFLEQCKSRCNKLIVGVDSDELVRTTKGSNRPIHGQMHRFNLISSMEVVDIAFILENIRYLEEACYMFKVDEIYKCEKFLDKHVYGSQAAELVIIPDIVGMISTTKIIERILENNLPVPTRE